MNKDKTARGDKTEQKKLFTKGQFCTSDNFKCWVNFAQVTVLLRGLFLQESKKINKKQENEKIKNLSQVN